MSFNLVQVNLCQKLLFLQIMGRTCCVHKLFWMSKSISVHNMFSPYSELGIFTYWTCNSMNNMLTSCGLASWCKNKSFWQRFTCTNLKTISTPFGTFSVQNKKVMFFINTQPYIQIKKNHAIKYQLWHFFAFFGTLNWRKPKNKLSGKVRISQLYDLLLKFIYFEKAFSEYMNFISYCLGFKKGDFRFREE